MKEVTLLRVIFHDITIVNILLILRLLVPQTGKALMKVLSNEILSVYDIVGTLRME